MRAVMLAVCLLVQSSLAAAQATLPEIVAQQNSPVDRAFLRDVEAPPIEELGAKADLIVEGTLTKHRTYLGPNKYDIYTEYLIHPIRILGGRTAPGRLVPGVPHLVLRLRGGSMTISGIPVSQADHNLAAFKNGDQFLMFVERVTVPDGDPVYVPLGEIIGLFKVENGRSRSMVIRSAGHPKELDGLPVDTLVAKALNSKR